VTLPSGSSLAFDYNSAIFSELVSRTTLSLETAGMGFIAEVQVVPQSTFLQDVYFKIDPAVSPRIVTFVGYRDVSIVQPAAGFNFGLEFGGDPGLRGGGPSATVTMLLSSPAPSEGFMIDSMAVFVYGFRGDRVLQDTVTGTAGDAIPEPATLLLVGTGLASIAVSVRSRRTRDRTTI
jgi:hypothetical protein